MHATSLKKYQYLTKPALSLLIAFGILQLKLDPIEFFLFDLRIRLKPQPTSSGQLELVEMDRDSVAVYKGVPTFAQHADVLQKIIAQKPLAVAYVTPLTRQDDDEEIRGRSESAPTGTAEEIKTFLKLAESFPNFYQLTDSMILKGESNKLNLKPPFDKISVISAPQTKDLIQFAKDGVTRRIILNYQNEDLGHLQLANLARPDRPRGDVYHRSFEVFDTKQVWIDFARPGSLSTTKFEDITRVLVEPGKFTGKIVLVGDDFDKTIHAYVKTPYPKPPLMSYLEAHGHILETLIRNSSPVRAPGWLNWLITSIVAIITVQAVFTMTPLRGLICLVGAAAAIFVVGFVAFWPFGVMISMAHALLTIFLTYYFFIPYRLIVESRRSWEYFQKHQLLSQVEALKTNFISMMSHDLKTPIARIQGMSDVIVKDANQLSLQQREAVDHIRQSSDDLLKFTNAVLNYAQIESSGVVLHRQSRDVNELLKEVVRKHEFLAKAKGIELITELEPLFSISVDPELITQVFSNLVENAIKYSPNGSKILISSEEKAGNVMVQVADQGIGIPSDELPNIFMKFFRSKDAKTSPIKGSGLGLYLAKYFVELHQGRIDVESSVGQGSTFIVELPVGN